MSSVKRSHDEISQGEVTPPLPPSKRYLTDGGAEGNAAAQAPSAPPANGAGAPGAASGANPPMPPSAHMEGAAAPIQRAVSETTALLAAPSEDLSGYMGGAAAGNGQVLIHRPGPPLPPSAVGMAAGPNMTRVPGVGAPAASMGAANGGKSETVISKEAAAKEAKRVKAAKQAAAKKKKAAAKKKKAASANPKLKVEDALAYLAKVKMEFDRKPAIYTKFLDIMKNFKAQAVDTPGVIKQVSHLFRGHDSLILGFNTFLPEDQRISTASLKEMNKKEEQAKKNRKKAAAQRKAKKEKEAAAIAKNQKSAPFGFDHAISYVTKIKRRFANSPDTYKQFLDILHLYKEHEQSIEGVLDNVSELFRDEPDLLKEFAYFLPEAVQQQAKERLSIAVQRSKQRQKAKKAKESGKKQDKSGKSGNLSSKKGSSSASREKPSKEDKVVEKKMPLIEKRFFKRVKAALGQQHLWMEFLKCLELYSKEVLNKGEFLSLVSDVLSALPSDEGEQYIEELEAVLEKRVVVKDMEDDTWLSMPASEIDLSQCRRSTPSYRRLPRNYPRPSCSMRSVLCSSVLNNDWVSVPTGSEDAHSFKNLRRNVFEEALFKCEDDRYEMDMVVDANKATIRRLGPIAKEIERLKESGQPLYQFRLDKRALGVIHLKAISRVYGNSGSEVLELLRKNPAGAIPVVLGRLKEKALEWGRALKDLNKQWKSVLEKNYQKSLDHRSYYFKQTERKAIMSKTLLQEIKAIKDRIMGKSGKQGQSQFHVGKRKKQAEVVLKNALESRMSLDASGRPKREIVTSPQMVYAFPDLEAHQDAFKIVVHASKNLGPEGFTNAEQLRELEDVFKGLIGRFFGLPEGFSSIAEVEGSSKIISRGDAVPAGTEVSTPYGKGTIKEFIAGQKNAQAQCYVVNLPFGDACISPNNVSTTRNLVSTATDKTTPSMISGNDMYVFFRLYEMLYRRIRKAKELCRSASALKKGKVAHWMDRTGTHPQTPGHLPASSPLHQSSDILSSPRAMSLSRDGDMGSPGNSPAITVQTPSKQVPDAPQRDYKAAEAKDLQVRSRNTYYEFLKALNSLLDETMDQQSYEDTCRELMGASTASYMLFTLDKLIRNLVRKASDIVTNETNQVLMELHDYEMSCPSGLNLGRYERNAKVALSTDAQENMFIISSKGGRMNKAPPIGGSQGPGMWQETIPWEKYPEMGFQLIGLGSDLRKEKVVPPSDLPAKDYVEAYMNCPTLQCFNASNPNMYLYVYNSRNKKYVKKWLDENVDKGENKKDGRDRRARERAASVRNAQAWSMGKIHVKDNLRCKLTLDDYRLRYFTGSEDFFYRIYKAKKDDSADNDESEDTSEGSSSSEGQKGEKKSMDDLERERERQRLEHNKRRTKRFEVWAKKSSEELIAAEKANIAAEAAAAQAGPGSSAPTDAAATQDVTMATAPVPAPAPAPAVPKTETVVAPAAITTAAPAVSNAAPATTPSTSGDVEMISVDHSTANEQKGESSSASSAQAPAVADVKQETTTVDTAPPAAGAAPLSGVANNVNPAAVQHISGEQEL